MSTIRFFGYYNYIIKQQPITEEDIKRDKVEKADWTEEVRELKNGKRKNSNRN